MKSADELSNPKLWLFASSMKVDFSGKIALIVKNSWLSKETLLIALSTTLVDLLLLLLSNVVLKFNDLLKSDDEMQLKLFENGSDGHL